jgi:hypothetical protein
MHQLWIDKQAHPMKGTDAYLEVLHKVTRADAVAHLDNLHALFNQVST